VEPKRNGGKIFYHESEEFIPNENGIIEVFIKILLIIF